MINSGWANNCAVELFTIGWVRCSSQSGSGSVQRKGFRLGIYEGPITFKGKTEHFDIEVPGKEEFIEPTPFGIQHEIDRHQIALNMIEVRLGLMEFSLAMNLKKVQLDAMMAEEFKANLQSKIDQLQIIKKRRADEEFFILMLIADEN